MKVSVVSPQSPPLFAGSILARSQHLALTTMTMSIPQISVLFGESVATYASNLATVVSEWATGYGYMILNCQRLQVIGPNTDFVFTDMMNLVVVRNWANKKFVDDSMCGNLTPIPSNLAITTRKQAGPRPATVSTDTNAPQQPTNFGD